MWAAACALALGTTACASATPKTRSAAAAPPPAADGASDARSSGAAAGAPYTAADVSFMSGMIRHHAQAVLMARWAPTHDASPQLRSLAERILASQQDEIAFMQGWLRDRGEPVPDAKPSHAGMTSGPGGPMLMPGMLTDEQLKQLDSARGAEFDRLFLTFMIRHHQGALTMVDQLFHSPGSGQHEAVFRFASDASADQTAEIERMTSMLSTLTNGEG